MRGIHHTALVTGDMNTSLRFWRDGLGLTVLLDYSFRGDWPTLFGAGTEELHSVFLGDPEQADSGIVELVYFEGAGEAGDSCRAGPRGGFFLVSLEREVEPTLQRLAELGFTEGVRRISMPAPGGKTVAMAVITAPDDVRVELIGSPK